MLALYLVQFELFVLLFGLGLELQFVQLLAQSVYLLLFLLYFGSQLFTEGLHVILLVKHHAAGGDQFPDVLDLADIP